MSATYLNRAKAGARYLDERLGRGWRRRVRRRYLRMSMGVYGGPGSCGCILAQLDEEGSWAHMSGEIGLTTDDPLQIALGFQAPGYRDEAYARLTEAWKQVLREGS